MKFKSFLNLVLGLLIAALISSCLPDNEVVDDPTAGEELILLNNYLNNLLSEGIDIDTTELGVYYIIIDEGAGDFPKAGDTLQVGYDGYFIDGFLFDSSENLQEDGTYEFELGNPPLIPGWEDGMKVINKEAKVQLIIPSNLAYGSSGSGVIPAFNTLIFVVKMIDIKPS
ncbi:MAG: hypothetical protein HN778_20955 [Prolixibacteraceae bacterium]|jgi:FKBP-type peptidyl-prolyl cis-trans isomerase FkpA|nr:hypothetical protein [Prolixibacteraceae bacterium]MBT6766428.1 hypothetical protein [Prolixibacteraceae bacterium]MBT7000949.1 hypothetical protein [Prolixibacteraceae bacterium]MBT7397306.1 hypothetical protein [Prolixibacteraceae bacterium]